MLLTIWPDSVWCVRHNDRVIRVGPLHFGVKVRLQVGCAVVTLECALRIADGSRHVHRLRPADLEAVPFGVFTLVEQVQRRVLKGHVEIGGVFRRDLVRAGRTSDLPIDDSNGFLRVRVVVGVWRACPGCVVASTACGYGVEEGDERVSSKREA